MPYGSVQKLLEFLDYNPEMGEFRWKLRPSKRTSVGAVAGYKNGQGYWQIEFRGKTYQAHRLAWLFTYEKWPRKEIDHINGIRDDNRIDNLREASKSQNQHNRKQWGKPTTSIFKGVTFHKASGKWAAHIQVNKARHH